MMNLGISRDAFGSEVLERAGGFVWWYFDLIDQNGNGFVLIWSFGLPFLPRQTRSVSEIKPKERPSICLSVYKNYRQFYYLFQEYPADTATCDSDCHAVQIGNSFFRSEMSETVMSLSSQIETPIPGSPHLLVGEVRAQGAPLRGIEDGASDSKHKWCPVFMNTQGSVRLEISGQTVIDLQGRAYYDSNLSLLPLQELGIDSWRWLRIAFPTRELVFYDLDPKDTSQHSEQIVLSVDSTGHASLCDLTSFQWTKPWFSIYGLTYSRELVLTLGESERIRLNFHPPVDDGPFYLRFLVDAVCETTKERGHGIGELVKPDRIHIAPLQPFVRMRVQKIDGSNSFLLPLFTGANGDRVKRFFSHLKRF